jgi:diadenosine tetraphosphate (Ap4A) HIT family hydrolase
MTDDVFCKIVAGEIKADVVYKELEITDRKEVLYG